MSGAIRVYELAAELGVSAQHLLAWLAGHRVFGLARTSWLDDKTAAMVRRAYAAGDGADSIPVVMLAHELRVPEPYVMAWVRDRGLHVVGGNECVPADLAALLRAEVATTRGAGERQQRDNGAEGPPTTFTFAKAPPTVDALADLLGLPRADLRRQHEVAAGPDAGLTRAGVYALIEDNVDATRPRRLTGVVRKADIARVLMLSAAETSSVMVAAGSAEPAPESIPRTLLPAVLRRWLRTVRRSSPARGVVAEAPSPAPPTRAAAVPEPRAQSANAVSRRGEASDITSPRNVHRTRLEGDFEGTRDSTFVADYELLELLGRGGMGRVFRARRRGTAGDVALKVLRQDLISSTEAVERFSREAAALQTVGGEFTARVLDTGVAGAAPFIVMELLDGSSLERMVDLAGPLPPDVVHAVAIGLADALGAIHGAGLVHRDLKPANVMLTTAGPKVIDFGVANLLDRPRITEDGVQPGTLPYMSPEQFSDGDAGSASDIFAWAGTVLFAVTGRDPFPGITPAAIMRAVLDDEPDGMRAISDSRVRSGLMMSFAKSSSDRPLAEELVSALLGGEPRTQALETAREAVSTFVKHRRRP